MEYTIIDLYIISAIRDDQYMLFNWHALKLSTLMVYIERFAINVITNIKY